MDAVVHSESDQEDRNDLSDLGQWTENVDPLEERADPVHPGDRQDDRQHGEAHVGGRPSPRSQEAGVLPAGLQPIDEEENGDDDQEGEPEEAPDLGLNVSGVREEQSEAEGPKLDAGRHVDCFDGVGDGDFPVDLCSLIVGGVDEHEDEPRCSILRHELAHEAELFSAFFQCLFVDLGDLPGRKLRGVDPLLRDGLLHRGDPRDDAWLFGRLPGDELGLFRPEQRLGHGVGGLEPLRRDQVTGLRSNDHLHDRLRGGVSEELVDALGSQDDVVLGRESLLAVTVLDGGCQTPEHEGGDHRGGDHDRRPSSDGRGEEANG